MGVVIGEDTELGKELRKWNKPYRYEPFPRMLYKARRRKDGIIRCIETEDRFIKQDSAGEGVVGAAEAWSNANMKEAKSEDDLLKLLGQGWVEGGPLKAEEAFKAREDDVAKEAAHRAHDDRNMSAEAKAIIAAVEADTFAHVAEIPAAPVRRRGRVKGSKNKPKEAVNG